MPGRKRAFRAAVIGLGTGMTSGAAIADDVDSVTTLEISDAVIEAMPHFDEGNFFLSRSPKSHIVQTDAFRYFARTGERFDVIASGHPAIRGSWASRTCSRPSSTSSSRSR